MTQQPTPTPAPEARAFDADRVDFAAAQRSDAFQKLRKDQRSFIFPMALIFLVWYFLYAILAIYVPSFMTTKVWGNINVGVVMGLLQFVSTFAITGLYVRFANRTLDPQAAALRADLENDVYPSTHTRGSHS
ncbi:DUF485 domain-containing protein [Rothia sp. ZJ1223]|uniref:DUF485 domain-containing protein n=1 Tax=Rothia sp. ZJ1223 TaxID=2811098 RepID=UPI00195DAA88|nr:DUF485 domain-containing protein [Rothia sp. ZJ1223]MBM7051329.1 DUF485 domain-containing protein [Rothia sp. ZJ1223]